ncbi:MAG: DUF5777 family beta-barrel protein [Saprospiraceae bacterium]
MTILIFTKSPFQLLVRVLFITSFLFFVGIAQGQEEKGMVKEGMEKKIKEDEKVIQTFRHTRIINSHSVETLPKRKLDFRIAHRFGDIAGSAGGWPTFYGLENASDVSIGFEYGVTDNIMVGINRAKGSGPLKQLVNTILKVRVMNQEVHGNLPFSLTVVGINAYSTMPRSNSPEALNFFEIGSHRFAYHLGFHIARKFSDAFSLQLNGAWTFRNIVDFDDQNDLPSVGVSMRWNVSKALGIIIDTNMPIDSDFRTSDRGFYPMLGIGFEFDTSGGHVFQLNLTNSTGLSETDFIPYTKSNWGDGQFRLGFTISRLFSL